MGQGQEITAIHALRRAAEEGQWLTLKNLHLVTHWLPLLSQILGTLNFNTNFRYVRRSQNTVARKRSAQCVNLVFVSCFIISGTQRIISVELGSGAHTRNIGLLSYFDFALPATILLLITYLIYDIIPLQTVVGNGLSCFFKSCLSAAKFKNYL